MTYPGLPIVLALGIGLGTFLYYWFSNSAQTNSPHGNGRHAKTEYSDPNYSWAPSSASSSSSRRRNSSKACEDLTCVICLQEITILTKQQLKQCSHVFHKECLDKWRTQGEGVLLNNCPICRSQIL